MASLFLSVSIRALVSQHLNLDWYFYSCLVSQNLLQLLRWWQNKDKTVPVPLPKPSSPRELLSICWFLGCAAQAIQNSHKQCIALSRGDGRGGCGMETHLCNKLLSSQTVKWTLIREVGWVTKQQKYTLPQQSPCSKWREPRAKAMQCEPTLWPCSFQSSQPLSQHRICSWGFGTAPLGSSKVSPLPAPGASPFGCCIIPCPCVVACSCALPSHHLSLTEYHTETPLIFPIILPCSPESISTCWTVIVLVVWCSQGKLETKPKGILAGGGSQWSPWSIPMGSAPVAAPRGRRVVSRSLAMLGTLSPPWSIFPNLWYEKISFPSIPSLLSPHHG